MNHALKKPTVFCCHERQKPYDRINQTEKTRSTRIHSVLRIWYIASLAVDTCKRISGPRTSTSEHDQIRTLTLVLNLKKLLK